MPLSSKIMVLVHKDFTNRKALITASGYQDLNDATDKDGKRPDKITVRLYANGTEVAHKEATECDKGE